MFACGHDEARLSAGLSLVLFVSPGRVRAGVFSQIAAGTRKMVVSNGYRQPFVVGQRVRSRRAVSTRQSLSFVLLVSRPLALLLNLVGVAESRYLGLEAVLSDAECD